MFRVPGQGGESPIARIVLLMEAGRDAGRWLELAGVLASRLGAPLLVVAMEDERFEKLAGHPLARQLDMGAGARDTSTLQERLKASYRRTERRLVEMAARLDVRWGLQRVRGEAAVADLVVPGDLLIRSGTASSTAGLMGRATAAILARRMPRRPEVRHAALVTYDGSPTSERALAAADRMILDRRVAVTFLLVADDEQTLRDLRQRLEPRLAAQSGGIYFARLSTGGLDRLPAMIDAMPFDFAVLGLDDALVPRQRAEALAQAVESCPVLVVRGETQVQQAVG